MPTDFPKDLFLIRKQKPLIHNITNYVVMNLTANVLLACGASPVMAHANEEVEDMVKVASALVINMGTLSPPWVEAMITAGRKANQKNIPVIFDPVGAGATKYRTQTAHEILKEVKISVLRGNASEIAAVICDEAKTKGVDSTHDVSDTKGIAKWFARDEKLVVAITGPIDYVTDGKKEIEIKRGHEMMSKITGTGCSATALIGAFCAVNQNYLQATANALTYFGKCGEKAAEKTQSPGSYGVALLDALYEISPPESRRHQKLTVKNIQTQPVNS